MKTHRNLNAPNSSFVPEQTLLFMLNDFKTISHDIGTVVAPLLPPGQTSLDPTTGTLLTKFCLEYCRSQIITACELGSTAALSDSNPFACSFTIESLIESLSKSEPFIADKLRSLHQSDAAVRQMCRATDLKKYITKSEELKTVPEINPAVSPSIRPSEEEGT